MRDDGSSGFRYLFTDGLLLGVRGSPPSKVATLSRESMALLHHVRAELDRRKTFETAPHDVRRRFAQPDPHSSDLRSTNPELCSCKVTDPACAAAPGVSGHSKCWQT